MYLPKASKYLISVCKPQALPGITFILGLSNSEWAQVEQTKVNVMMLPKVHLWKKRNVLMIKQALGCLMRPSFSPWRRTHLHRKISFLRLYIMRSTSRLHI